MTLYRPQGAALKGLLLVLLILIIGAHNACLSAAFNDYGRGARPAGMGDAYTAVQSGADAALFNPAGITGVRKFEASFTSSKLYAGLEGVELGQNDLACARYLGERTGYVAVSWHALYTPALYREDTLALTYGRKAAALGAGRVLYAGGNVKYLRDRFELDRRTENDPVFRDGNGKGNVSVDLGLLVADPGYGITAGLASRDINKPDMGLRTEDRVVNENALGASFTTGFGTSSPVDRVLLAADIVQRGNDFTLRAGVEAGFGHTGCVVRAGYMPQAFTLGLGYEASFGRGALGIDYAFALPTEVRQSLGTHRLGLRLRFE